MDVVDRLPVRKFTSPARVLVRSLRMSRDNWKQKYQKLQQDAKRLQVRASDAGRSRDGWRQRAEAAEQELARLKANSLPAPVGETAPKKLS